jgi:hypothetical protein
MSMMNKLILSAAIAFAAPVAVACDYPPRPNDLPNGATASKQQMLDGVKTIKAYQEAMGTYLSCIEADQAVAAQNFESADKETKKQSEEMFNKKYNAAVEEQTLSVEEFNAQIRAYKDK